MLVTLIIDYWFACAEVLILDHRYWGINYSQTRLLRLKNTPNVCDEFEGAFNIGCQWSVSKTKWLTKQKWLIKGVRIKRSWL